MNQSITVSNNFIILDTYNKIIQQDGSYQTETDLEKEFIQDLINQGYEYLPNLNTNDKMLANIKSQLQKLNNIQFSEQEWLRFCRDYLNKPNDNQIDKTSKIHNNYIYDFVFDDGQIKNIYLVNKKNILKNHVQVISQFEQTGIHKNRYDVTILVNGIPMIQIELKKRGIAVNNPLT